MAKLKKTTSILCYAPSSVARKVRDSVNTELPLSYFAFIEDVLFYEGILKEKDSDSYKEQKIKEYYSNHNVQSEYEDIENLVAFTEETTEQGDDAPSYAIDKTSGKLIFSIPKQYSKSRLSPSVFRKNKYFSLLNTLPLFEEFITDYKHKDLNISNNELVALENNIFKGYYGAQTFFRILVRELIYDDKIDLLEGKDNEKLKTYYKRALDLFIKNKKSIKTKKDNVQEQIEESLKEIKLNAFTSKSTSPYKREFNAEDTLANIVFFVSSYGTSYSTSQDRPIKEWGAVFSEGFGKVNTYIEDIHTFLTSPLSAENSSTLLDLITESQELDSSEDKEKFKTELLNVLSLDPAYGKAFMVALMESLRDYIANNNKITKRKIKDRAKELQKDNPRATDDDSVKLYVKEFYDKLYKDNEALKNILKTAYENALNSINKIENLYESSELDDSNITEYVNDPKIDNSTQLVLSIGANKLESRLLTVTDIFIQCLNAYAELALRKANSPKGYADLLINGGFYENTPDNVRLLKAVYEAALNASENYLPLLNILGVKGVKYIAKQGIQAEIGETKKAYDKNIEKIDNNSQYNDETKERLKDNITKKASYYVREYQTLLDNFDSMFNLAIPYIEEQLGVKLVDDLWEGNNYIDDASIEDNEEYDRVTGSESFDHQALEIDAFNTINSTARYFLRGLHTSEKNDLGKRKLITPEVAFRTLLRELEYMCKPEDFYIKSTDDQGNVVHSFPALEELKGKYFFVEGILGKLQVLLKEKPEYGEFAVASLYSAFQKSFHKMKGLIDGKLVNFNTGKGHEPEIMAVQDNISSGKILTESEDDSYYNIDGSINLDALNNIDIKIQNAKKKLYTLSTQAFAELLKPSPNKTKIQEIETYISELEELCKAFGIIPTINFKEAFIKHFKNSNKSDIYKMLDIFDNIIKYASKFKDKEGVNVEDTWDKTWNHFRDVVSITGAADAIIEAENFKVESSKTGKSNNYYSYGNPSNMELLLKELCSPKWGMQALERYKQSKWFYDKEKDEFNNLILQNIYRLQQGLQNGDDTVLEDLQNIRFNFIPSIEGEPYSEASEDAILQTMLASFTSQTKVSIHDDYYYRDYVTFLPSDAPVLVTLSYSETSEFGCYNYLKKLVLQEIFRIKNVKKRREKGLLPYKKYDDIGEKFCFFPELNDGSFFQECEKIINSTDPSINNEKVLDDFIKSKIEEIIEKRTESLKSRLSEKNKQLFENAQNFILKRKGSYYKNDEFTGYYEFILQNTLMMASTMQVFMGDFAFFTDYEDFQKRAKMVYAMGQRLCTTVMGKQEETFIVLKDDTIVSQTYADLLEVVEQAEKEGKLKETDVDFIKGVFANINSADGQSIRSEESALEILKGLGENVEEVKRILDKFDNGTWTMQDFQRLITIKTKKPLVSHLSFEDDGTGTGNKIPVPHYHKNSEFPLLLGTILSKTFKSNSKLNALYEFMKECKVDVIHFESAEKTGTQGVIDITTSSSKISDYIEGNKLNNTIPLLYESVQNYLNSHIGETSRLRKLAEELDIIEEEDGTVKNYESVKGILKKHFPQFLYMCLSNRDARGNYFLQQSSYNNIIKDIQMSEEEIIETLKDKSGIKTTNGVITDFNPDYVKQIPYTSWMQQQPTNDHIKDVHHTVFGSQLRNHIIADLPEDFVVTIDGKDYTKQEIITFYKKLITANIIDSYKQVVGRLGNIKELQQMLLKQIRGNTKFTVSMQRSLDIITDEEGNQFFNIDLDDFQYGTKWEQVILAAFKNGITKQEINGGTAILVSDFGLSDRLKVRWETDKNGNKYPTGVECLLPATSKHFFDPFLKRNSDGSRDVILDIEKMQKECPELLEAIGYRIPTEDKYSMVPLVIKGFLPEINGGCIMLASDVVALSGSDFDIDKLYMMFKAFKHNNFIDQLSDENINTIITNSPIRERIENYIESVIDKDYNKYTKKRKRNKKLDKKILTKEEFVKKHYSIKQQFKLIISHFRLTQEAIEANMKRNGVPIPEYKSIEVIKYDHSKGIGENTKEQRDNMIIDIMRSILIHPSVASTWLTAGNYKDVTKQASINRIIRDKECLKAIKDIVDNNSELKKIYGNNYREYLYSLSSKQLSKLYSKYRSVSSPTDVQTQAKQAVQNFVGLALVGISANASVFKSKSQNTKLELNKEIKLGNKRYKSLTNILGEDNTRIQSLFAQYRAAAVDNGKDPQLGMLYQNPNTAYITLFLVSLGWNYNQINLLLSHPALSYYFESNRGNYEGIKHFKSKLYEQLDYFKDQITFEEEWTIDETNLSIDSTVEFPTITEKEEEGITSYESNMSIEDTVRILQHSVQVIRYFEDIMNKASDYRALISVCRADSPNGAVPPSLAELYIRLSKLRTLNLKHLKGYKDMLRSHESLGITDFKRLSTQSTDDILEMFFSENIDSLEMVQAFMTLGQEAVLDILEPYFIACNPLVADRIFTLINNREGRFSAKSLKNYIHNLELYMLSTTKLFGNSEEGTFEQKKAYYDLEFIRDYKQLLMKYRDLRENLFIKSLVIEKDKYTGKPKFVIRKVTGRNRIEKDAIGTALLELLLSDNDDYKKLAIKFMQYAYFRENFKFQSGSINHVFNDIFKASFHDYVDTLRDKESFITPAFLDEYEKIFIANNSYLAVSVDHVSDIKVSNNGILSVPQYYVKHADNNIDYLKYIRYKQVVYVRREGDYVRDYQGNIQNVNYEPLPITAYMEESLNYNANTNLEALVEKLQQEKESQQVDSNDKTIKISGAQYNKNTAVNNKEKAYIFADNIEALVKVLESNNEEIPEFLKPYLKDNTKLNVNKSQALIRTDAYGQINSNVFGIITKKTQTKEDGNFDYSDTSMFTTSKEDLELFKQVNEYAIERIKSSNFSTINFPKRIGGGIAKMQKEHCEILQELLKEHFGIKAMVVSDSEKNYSLILNPTSYKYYTPNMRVHDKSLLFEVSTKAQQGSLGLKFSALNAKFKTGTVITIKDQEFNIEGKSIEDAYMMLKGYNSRQEGKGKAPTKDSVLYNPEISDENNSVKEDYLFFNGYLPLWELWAEQNKELVLELILEAQGKIFKDSYAKTSINQARAITWILNDYTKSPHVQEDLIEESGENNTEIIIADFL